MSADDRLRELGTAQHAAVSRQQARGLGLDADALAHRVRRGEWVPAARRVLRAAAAPVTDRQRVVVEVLDAGEGAFASHRTAAALWGLPGFDFGSIEITRRRPSSLRRPGHVEHRPRLVLPSHVTSVKGIACSSLPRTIFDLASPGLSEARLLRLVSSVVARSPGLAAVLHQALEELAGKGRPGITVMRSVLAEHPPGIVPPTGLERRCEELLRQAGQRPLRRQVDTGGHSWVGRVDYVDDDVLLVVEVDSQLHHTSPADRARDAMRDRRLLAAGYREVLRVPEEHIWWQPHLVAPAVRDARARCRAARAA